MNKLSDFVELNGGKYGVNCRINRINEICLYFSYARYIKGRQMIRISGDKRKTSGWYKFKFDSDRKAINRAAGWSDKKDVYYLENPQIK